MRWVVEKGRGVRHILAGAAMAGFTVCLSACEPSPEFPAEQEWQEQEVPAQPEVWEADPVDTPPQQPEPVHPTMPPE